MPEAGSDEDVNQVTASEGREPDIWEGDLLGRKAEAEFLEKFLVNRVASRRKAGRSGTYVLEIDANWGAGKTFFLEHFGKQLASSGHVVATINAWRDDQLDDPFISVMTAIDTALKPFAGEREKILAKVWRRAKRDAIPIAMRAGAGALRQVLQRATGLGLREIAGEDLSRIEETSSPQDGVGETIVDSAVAAAVDEVGKGIGRVFDQSVEKEIERFQASIAAVESFQQRFARTVATLGDLGKKSKKLPFFILVDELDRCRPSYAIALLERVKHLFNVENVVFVFATNAQQLGHSVAGAYGANFDGLRYLKRFFDRTYNFADPKPGNFVKHCASEIDFEKLIAPGGDPAAFLCFASEKYRLALRDIQQIIELIGNVVDSWPHASKIESVTLFALAADFARNGSLDLIRAIDSIPSELAYSYPTSRYKAENREQLHCRDIAQFVVQKTSDKGKVSSQLENIHSSSVGEYLFQVFQLELRSYTPGDPSQQNELPSRIRSAGRLS